MNIQKLTPCGKVLLQAEYCLPVSSMFMYANQNNKRLHSVYYNISVIPDVLCPTSLHFKPELSSPLYVILT